MKTLKALLLSLSLLAFPALAQAQTAPTQATFNWSYTFNTAYPVPCSATVTVNCVANFLLTQGTTTVATVPTTTATAYSFNLTTLPAPGTYTYSLVAVGAFQGGTIASAPVTVSLQVPATVAPAASFTVVLH
jgi:hypothetical protein